MPGHCCVIHHVAAAPNVAPSIIKFSVASGMAAFRRSWLMLTRRRDRSCARRRRLAVAHGGASSSLLFLIGIFSLAFLGRLAWCCYLFFFLASFRYIPVITTTGVQISAPIGVCRAYIVMALMRDKASDGACCATSCFALAVVRRRGVPGGARLSEKIM